MKKRFSLDYVRNSHGLLFALVGATAIAAPLLPGFPASYARFALPAVGILACGALFLLWTEFRRRAHFGEKARRKLLALHRKLAAARQKPAAENNRTEAVFRAIVNQIPVGIFLKDPADDYRYLLWNRRLSQDSGLRSSEVEGKSDYEMPIFQEKADDFREQDERIMQTETALAEEENLPTAGGIDICYQTTKMPLTLADGKQYVLGIFVDVTARKQLEKDRAAEAESGPINSVRLLVQDAAHAAEAIEILHFRNLTTREIDCKTLQFAQQPAAGAFLFQLFNQPGDSP